MRELGARLDEVLKAESEAWGDWSSEVPRNPKKYEKLSRESDTLNRTLFGMADRLIFLKRKKRTLEGVK